MSESVNKITLARAYSERYKVKNSHARVVVDRIIKLIVEDLSSGKEVYIRSLGSFRIVERQGRIVRTGKGFSGSDYLPPFRAVRYIPSKGIKQALKKK